MPTLPENIDKIIEAALFSAVEPLSVDKLSALFSEENRPAATDIREILNQLKTVYEDRGVELVEVASGFRFQVRLDYAPFLQRLEERKPPKYSRSFLETLAIIAYRQPVTRGEIEDIRGVAVNPVVIKTLLERDWIKIAGYREVPGKPALLATTKTFLDYFNLKNLRELPPLSELVDFESLEKQLGLGLPEVPALDNQENGQNPVEKNETLENSDHLEVLDSEEAGETNEEKKTEVIVECV